MKKLGILLLVVTMTFVFFSCGTKDKEDAADENKTQTEAANDENQQDINEETADNQNDDNEEAEEAQDNQSDKTDSDEASLITKYTGTWNSKGLLLSDGSIDSSAEAMKVVLNKDGSATISSEKGTGTWDPDEDEIDITINGKDIELKINEDGNLLLSTGERDGKGNILNYLLSKK